MIRSSTEADNWASDFRRIFDRQRAESSECGGGYQDLTYQSEVAACEPPAKSCNSSAMSCCASTIVKNGSINHAITGLPPNLQPPEFCSSEPPIAVTGFRQISRIRQPLLDAKPTPRLIISPSSSSASCRQQQNLSKPECNGNRASKDDTAMGPVFGAMLLLQQQILNPGGVLIHGAAADFRSSVAFADVDNRVWVAGWKTKCTRLHGLFHIGDQVMMLNDFPITTAHEVYKALESIELSGFTTISACGLRIRRLPLAKALGVRRSTSGQSVGLRMEDGKNRVASVVPDGLAARTGLTLLADPFRLYSSNMRQSMHRFMNTYGGQQPWCITEINGYSLNMFNKHGEAAVLLNAYGMEMTLVLQPADFICLLKKQLKTFRNYATYIPR
ncbi:unnamed protein product [Calicophoron daubneyi]|uniref:PDZ domain-containing protein n=1 Tax=Calicophoron daubneyi TaxID=300641 RepID=A0AAV2TUF2_CALDB